MKTIPMPLDQCEEWAPEGLSLESGDGAMATADAFLPAAPAQIYLQKFAVRYEYPVAFTRDLFLPANRILVETLARLELNCRHKAMVFVDDGLAAREDLPSRVTAYAAVHKHAIELVAPPEFVTGGGRCKNDPALVERLQRSLVELAIDRHAFVVAIGGWRVHYHIPLFLDDLGPFSTTQSFVREALALHRQDPISPHLEVETYTWAVLPARYRTTSLAPAIARELQWVRHQFPA